MNGSNQLLSIMDVLQNNFESMTRHFKVVGSGRTIKMLESIPAAILKVPFKIPQTFLIVILDLRSKDYMLSHLVDILKQQGFTVSPKGSNTILIGDLICVDFVTPYMLRRYVGMYPDPIRFIDHSVEEMVISEGLDQIKKKLKLLKTGE